ncbi:unnamed protein product [Parnassius apollo]|uniref:(apollo) hypothetical protein n=1 Tax=Parnassius apollo TaxID=110799 RepID=A0A8S3XJV9_PARAO|nr:unnamed protein product [Parnassius apollo]
MDLKHNSVIALYLEGKSNIEIRRALPNLKLNEKFVHRTIKRYSEIGSIKKRYGGGQRCTATAPAVVEKVRHRLDRNPARSVNQLAQDLKELTAFQRSERLERSKELIRLLDSGELPNLVFSDEKTFCVEHFLNKPNDRVWLKGRVSNHADELQVTRRQGADQIMVWAAVSEKGRSPLVFLPMGRNQVKINQQIYRYKVLIPGLIPWARNTFSSER